MNRIMWSVVGLCALAACSSDASPEAEVTTPPPSDVETSVPAESSEEPGGEPTTSLVPSEERDDRPGDDDAPTTTARPFVINGPATVDDDLSGEQADDSDDDADLDRSPCLAVPRGVAELQIEGGGAVHDVRIFVPDELLSEPAPVVLNWHGLGSNGPEQALYSGYEDLAAAEGFIVIHPTGVSVTGDDRTSWELAQFDMPGRDDVAFSDVLIDTAIADWCVDPRRVYSTGMSNGGFFTSELVCKRADRIAAAASVAGISHAEGCDPSRAVPYISFHGTDDGVVPFDGSGESPLADDSRFVGDFFSQVMPDEFAEFAADFGCDAEPLVIEESPEVIRYDYVDCDDETPMTFYELPGSGHTWPSSPLSDAASDLIGYHTQDISATADAWAFFRQHSL